MFRALWFSVLLVLLADAQGARHARAETARGSVYADINGNGVRDVSEPGIAGIAVSNGQEVVETDARGAWTLTVRDGDVLFVVKPRDHRLPLDERGLPRFYYVHRPDGTPSELSLRYPGVAPTGPLPDSIDFGLIPAVEARRFDVVLLADTQPQSHVELDYVRDDVFAALVGVDASFGMTLGDILYDDLSLAPRYAELVGRIGIPWFHVPGNHELNFLAPDDDLSLETYKQHFGPTSYSFDVADAHFVVLDNVIYAGTSRGSDGAPVRGNGGYRAGFTARQLEWLERDLARVPADRLVVVAMHIPLRTWLDPTAANANVLDLEHFFSILSRRERVISFAGHTHTVEHHYFDDADGWKGERPLHQHVLATVSGSWWTGPLDERGIPTTVQRDGVPNGYSILEIDGVQARVHYRAAHFADDHQMRIGFDRAFHQLGAALLRDYRPGELQAGPLLQDELSSTEVYVNLFNGGPRSEVWVQWDDRDAWTLLSRSFRKDPHVVEWMARHRDLMKGWVQPVDTGHLWTGPMPSDLGPGAHLLRVRAVDEYGTEHHGTRVFEVRR